MSEHEAVLQFRGILPLALACPFDLQPSYPDPKIVVAIMEGCSIQALPCSDISKRVSGSYHLVCRKEGLYQKSRCQWRFMYQTLATRVFAN